MDQAALSQHSTPTSSQHDEATTTNQRSLTSVTDIPPVPPLQQAEHTTETPPIGNAPTHALPLRCQPIASGASPGVNRPSGRQAGLSQEEHMHQLTPELDECRTYIQHLRQTKAQLQQTTVILREHLEIEKQSCGFLQRQSDEFLDWVHRVDEESGRESRGEIRRRHGAA